MKIKNKFMLIGISALGLVSLASCGDDKSNVESIKIDNLEYREIGISENQGGDPSNPYNYDSGPTIKYVNNKNELDLEIYLGFPRGYLFGVEFDLLYDDSLTIDEDQEITLTLYRNIGWHGEPTTSEIKITEPITTEIYSFKEKLGYFINGEFNRDSRNIKCEDVVTIEELNKNYYDIGSETVRTLGDNGELYYTKSFNYCIVGYYFTLSCDETDYIKYIKNDTHNQCKKSEDGLFNPFDVREKYNDVNKIRFQASSFTLEKLDDDSIATFWYDKDGKHYY